MSNQEDSEEIIRNEDTLMRRAWVDRALSGVRRRLECGEDLGAGALPGEAAGGAERPQLSVVPSGRQR